MRRSPGSCACWRVPWLRQADVIGGWQIPLDWGIWALALSAFLSSTLLPGSSEIVLAALARQGQWPSSVLLGTASAANTLGGLTTYGLGRLAAAGWSRRGVPDARALARMRSWGYPALLFSWLPVIGDALCLAAGWLRLHWLYSALLLWIGKGLRYAVVLWLVQ